ncbi:MAG: type II secretion system protein GspG [Luteolibacter sp.]
MKIQTRRPHLQHAAFTLLEMVIVLGIIAMIMGGAIFAMRGIADGAKPQRAKGDINTYLSALELYKINNNRYPSTSEGLAELSAKNKKVKIVKDPWERDYVYRFPGKIDSSSPEIISLGADGQEGTDDDINSQKM